MKGADYFPVLEEVLSAGDGAPLPASAGFAPGKVFRIVSMDSWYVAQEGRNSKRNKPIPAILRPLVIDIRASLLSNGFA